LGIIFTHRLNHPKLFLDVRWRHERVEDLSSKHLLSASLGRYYCDYHRSCYYIRLANSRGWSITACTAEVEPDAILCMCSNRHSRPIVHEKSCSSVSGIVDREYQVRSEFFERTLLGLSSEVFILPKAQYAIWRNPRPLELNFSPTCCSWLVAVGRWGLSSFHGEGQKFGNQTVPRLPDSLPVGVLAQFIEISSNFSSAWYYCLPQQCQYGTLKVAERFCHTKCVCQRNLCVWWLRQRLDPLSTAKGCGDGMM